MLIDKNDYMLLVTGGEIQVKTKALNGKMYKLCTVNYDTAAVTADYEDVEKLAELLIKCGGGRK